MKNILRTSLCAMALLISASGVNAKGGDDGLKDAYKNYFKIGVAVNMRNISVLEQIELIKKNYNSITAENDMKPGSTQPKEGEFNWKNADKIADFARQNGIKLRGHCLVWHNQIGKWMFYDDNGNLVSKDVLFARMKTHIQTIVNRYKDVIYCWDVVNEAITDDDKAENPYRQSLLYKIAGDEFIAKAFEYAHQADPKAVLYYNDYSTANPGKRDRIYNMVKKMQQAGVPITGIGMQGHYNITGPSSENIDAAIKKFAKLVKHIQFTELDVRVTKDMGGQLKFKRESIEISDDVKAKQEKKYSELFKIFRDNKKVIDCVTFWNLSDRDSWLGARNYPLLFDVKYQPKKVYYLIKDFKKK